MEKEYVTLCGSFYYRCSDQFLYGYYIILLVTIYHQIIKIMSYKFIPFSYDDSSYSFVASSNYTLSP